MRSSAFFCGRGEITDFLRTKPLTLTATVDAERAYRTADVVVIATPTDYDPERNLFNTSTVEAVLTLVGRVNPGALVVIKSTVPVGYTERIVGRFGCARLLFSPEFLREGRALYDNLHPSRIVVGRPHGGTATEADARRFASLLQQGAAERDIPTLYPAATVCRRTRASWWRTSVTFRTASSAPPSRPMTSARITSPVRSCKGRRAASSACTA